jgi:hypothetical protein
MGVPGFKAIRDIVASPGFKAIRDIVASPGVLGSNLGNIDPIMLKKHQMVLALDVVWGSPGLVQEIISINNLWSIF